MWAPYRTRPTNSTLRRENVQCQFVNIFLPINLSIWFEYPQHMLHMFGLRNKKIICLLARLTEGLTYLILKHFQTIL